MLGTKVHETKQGYAVYAVLNQDISSLRIAVDIYVVTPAGKMSDIMTIKRSSILKGKGWANTFLDMYGEFEQDDIDEIQKQVKELLSKKEQISLGQSRATVEEVHRAISKYIEKNKESLDDNPKANCFVKDKIGYMATNQMDYFIKENAELGYKRLEVLKYLKYLGVLQPADTRAYDTLISLSGEKVRYYKFELAEEADEEDAEVITA